MNNVTAMSAARNRIASLLDAGSFVEIGGEVTARATDFNLQDRETPGDGVVTGYGLIDGNLVYVYSQDTSVLNGSVGEMHAKKIVKMYDMALKMGAPIIGLIDCAGMRLQEGTDAMEAFGSLYRKQASASGVIPQITAVFGTCGGGAAVMAALSDFTFMEEKTARLFINSPNAIPGNEIGRCDTSSAEFQSREAGLVDGVGTEAEIFADIRFLVCMLPCNNEDNVSYSECTDDLNRSCQGMEDRAGDAGAVCAELSDDHLFFETKKDYARDMVTGFIRLNGMTVGAVGNRCLTCDSERKAGERTESSLSAEGARKAAEFVGFCDAFQIPVLTLVNVNGYAAKKDSERYLARAAAKLIYAFSSATVPKVTVVTGEAIGSAYAAMNSKGIGADIVYAWPDSRIGLMDGESAARIMYPEAEGSVQREKAREYASLQTSPLSAARRGYVDTVIRPEDTRKYVIGALEMLFTKREESPSRKHGTV